MGGRGAIGAEFERRRREDQGAEGAEGAEEVGCGEGVESQMRRSLK